MKKTLIELHDVSLLAECKKWLTQHPEKENLFLAKNVKESINFMQICTVDFLLIDLSTKSSEADGLESLATLSVYDLSLKIAVLIPAEFKTEVDKKFNELNSLYFIKRPNTLADFIDLIDVLEFAELLSNPLAEMCVADFFILLEMQKKTCLLAIETVEKPKKGMVCFNQGVLYNASYADSRAESALLEILSWKNVKISFKTLDSLVIQKIHRQVHLSLSELIAKSAKTKAVSTTDTTDSLRSDETEDSQPIELTVEILSDANSEHPAEEVGNQKVDALAVTDEQPLDLMVDDIIARAEAMIKSEESKAKIKAESKVETEAKLKEVKTARLAKLALEEFLNPLQEINQYLASCIFDIQGKVLAKHSDSAYDIEAIDALAENAVVLITNTLAAISGIGFGKCNFIQMRCSDSILEVVWVIEEQFAAAVLLAAEAKNTGLAKMYLTRICDEICRQLT